MASKAEIEAARRAFIHEIYEEIRNGNEHWSIGPCLGNATRAALEAAERVRAFDRGLATVAERDSLK
jgi:hypothetical protein